MDYYNRKDFYSIVLQVVINSFENLLIFLLDILAQLMIIEYFIILHYIICLIRILEALRVEFQSVQYSISLDKTSTVLNQSVSVSVSTENISISNYQYCTELISFNTS